MHDVFVKDFTKDGKCSNCGKCCSCLLPLSQSEITRIKEYIKKNNIKEQRHNVASGVDLTCPFRDEANKKCLIYPIRPQICRTFVCNHKIEDIEREKLIAHRKNKVCFMRNEFFGNSEDLDFFLSIIGGRK